MHPLSSGSSLVLAGVVLVACAGEVHAPGDGIELVVAPLTLPGLSKVCYDVRITNAADGDGDVVWQRGAPGLSAAGSPDADALCSTSFGDGGGGAISYVAPCDADGQLDADAEGERANSVTIWVDGLYDASGAWLDPAGPDGWRNPCAAPDGCSQDVVCSESADTRVVFDLTVMRAASQGFFDVAVLFDDIFCSAKVDCAYSGPNAGPIRLVLDPESGERVPTVVWALACTDGDPGAATADATHLYMDEVVLRCGADVYRVDPAAGPGNLYPGGVGAPAPLVQAMVVENRESATSGGADADILGWNVLLGLDASWFTAASPECVLETRATASHGPLLDGETPDGASYPIITVAVAINDGAAIVCTQHPLDGAAPNDGVRTAYTPTTTALAFVAAATAGGITTEPVEALVDECTSSPCGVGAACTDLAVGFTCACAAGYTGDGFTCDAIDACLTNPCGGANTTCVDLDPPALGDAAGRQCLCRAGYLGDPETGCTRPDGTSAANAGSSCLQIKTAYPSSTSASYFIDTDGGSTANALQVWCDMVGVGGDGGGWTLVAKSDGDDHDHVGSAPVAVANLQTAATTSSGYIGDANRLTLGKCYRFTCSATTRYAYVTNTLGMLVWWGNPNVGIQWSETYTTNPAGYTIGGSDDVTSSGSTTGPAYLGRNWARPFNADGVTPSPLLGCGLFGEYGQRGTMYVKACIP